MLTLARYTIVRTLNLAMEIISIALMVLIYLLLTTMVESSYAWGSAESILNYNRGLLIGCGVFTALLLLWWFAATTTGFSIRSFAERFSFVLWLFFSIISLILTIGLFTAFRSIQDESGRQIILPCVFSLWALFEGELVLFTPVNLSRVLFPKLCGFFRVLLTLFFISLGVFICYWYFFR